MMETRNKTAFQRQVSAILLILLIQLIAVIASQSIDCDFTNGNLCGWIVDSQDQLHLQVMQEEQPPTELRTANAFDSDYVFVTMGQMVTKNRGSAKMRVISPYFETTTLEEGGQSLPLTRCFSFWYRSASWKRSVQASFTFGLQSGADFFQQEMQSENSNVWRYKQVDVQFKRPTDQIRLVIDAGDTYFSYVAFDHFHLSSRSCDDAQYNIIDKYRNLGGNCPGDYLAQYSQPIGCFKCTLTECLQTCQAFAYCRGVSWVDRKALNEAFPGNSQCYLKSASCWPNVIKFEGGYKFYERIEAGYSLTKFNSTSSNKEDPVRTGFHSQFQALPTIFTAIPAPRPGASASEMSKWIPRKAKDDHEFHNTLARLEKSMSSILQPSPTPEKEPPPRFVTKDDIEMPPKMGTEQTSGSASSEPTLAKVTTLDITTQFVTEPAKEPPPTRTSDTPSSPTPLPTSRYSLVPSPFPNSKHIYGYIPLQPFGNCGGHFIIDENHQYLGCTRCSFAQCATLCSLSEQCRGFSFTESILVAKQCYLKTALTCEPQPSSTGFKYFTKIRKSGEDLSVSEASSGRNGIGAFTIKPVMPRQTTNSEQESREASASTAFTMNADLATPMPWLQPSPAVSEWPNSNNLLHYVQLSGNCAGAFLRDRSGEAVTCPRCSLAACQKLCDQDDECRGISYSTDQAVAVQCYLKTVDNCSPLSENSGYYFHAKKD